MLGGYFGNYYVMLAGRVLFGIGGESMAVAQSTLVAVWFQGKELNFALALNIFVGRLSSALNGLLLPWIFNIGD